MLDHSEESIKVIVVGDGNVGKTCMLRRFVKGDFIEQYRKTIGAEFMEKDVYLRSSDTTMKLMLWDTAGQEVFNALTQAYYRGAGAAVLAFSTVDRDSFMNIAGWKQRVESVCGSVTMVLCQTKFDLSHEAVITNEEAEQLASQLGVPLFRVSTRDDFNVTQLFEFTAQQCMEGAAAEALREARQAGAEETSAMEPTSVALEASPTFTPAAVPAQTSSSGAVPAASFIPAGAPAASTAAAAAVAGRNRSGTAAAPAKSKGKGASSGSKNKVTLMEPPTPGQHHKRRFKCSLF